MQRTWCTSRASSLQHLAGNGGHAGNTQLHRQIRVHKNPEETHTPHPSSCCSILPLWMNVAHGGRQVHQQAGSLAHHQAQVCAFPIRQIIPQLRVQLSPPHLPPNTTSWWWSGSYTDTCPWRPDGLSPRVGCACHSMRSLVIQNISLLTEPSFTSWPPNMYTMLFTCGAWGRGRGLQLHAH